MSVYFPGDVIGTCWSNPEIADKLDIDEEDVEETMLDNNVERCSFCGYWFESGELTPDEETEGDDDELVGLCADCRKDR